MTLLVIGLVLWWAVHLLKRIAPGVRASIDSAVGAGPARGIVAGLIFLSVILMVIGYRGGAFTPVYDPPSWGIHLNNLLMLIAVILIGMGSSKGRARSWLRHPMLIGTLVWALSHLLVNGDLHSVILFGGIGLWAIVSILVINARSPAWVRPEPGPISGDIRLLIIGTVLFLVISLIHGYVLGYWPFPG